MGVMGGRRMVGWRLKRDQWGGTVVERRGAARSEGVGLIGWETALSVDWLPVVQK